MKIGKYTPGPWGYKMALGQKSYQVYPASGIKKHDEAFVLKDYEAAGKWLGVAICHCYGRNLPPDQSAEANVRLIAAAPLMAEALKNLVKADEAYNQDNDLNDDWEPLNLAREALKAAGLNDENEGE